MAHDKGSTVDTNLVGDEAILGLEDLDRAHPKFVRMFINKWQVIRDLLGGVKVMRAAKKRYLVQKVNEKKKNYDVRVEETNLYPGLRKAVDRALGLPYSQAVKLEGELPTKLGALTVDIDADGTDLTLFTRQVTEDAIAYGKTHILVDFPVRMKNDEGEDVTLSRAQEDKLNIRPRFVHIKALDLFNWQEGRVNGKKILTEIRYHDERYEANEQGLIVRVEQVKILTETTFAIWERKETSSYELAEEGTVEWPTGEIPLVVMYTDKTGFMTAEPPLFSLAEANIAHWRDSSDHTQAVGAARTALFFFAGFEQDVVEKNVAIGARSMVTNTSPEARISLVEHTGGAIDTSRTENDKLENRVDRLGAEPMNERSDAMVATGIAINERDANSDLQAWLQMVEVLMREAYALAFAWVGEEMPDDFLVRIFRDFVVPMSTEDSAHLLNMRESGQIEQETYLKEEVRRGTLDRNVDIAKIIENTKSDIDLIDDATT